MFRTLHSRPVCRREVKGRNKVVTTVQQDYRGGRGCAERGIPAVRGCTILLTTIDHPDEELDGVIRRVDEPEGGKPFLPLR